MSKQAGNGRTSTPELVRSIATDTATLVRKEVELARQEVVEGIMAKVTGAIALAVAGALGLIALVFLGGAMAAWLATYVQPWASWLITAGSFLLLAGLAAVVGLGRMKRSSVAPKETKRTVKEDVEWAKAQLKR